MSNTNIENSMEFESLDKLLSEQIDKDIISELDNYLEVVKTKSKALSSSLKRCFENARKSQRFLLAYKLGQKDKIENKLLKNEVLKNYLEDYLKDYFEKNDFMHYREFIRLNRACAIDVGVEVSSKIKDMYNDFFSGKRLTQAYKLGLMQNQIKK
jgi:hypothetical protein